MGFWDTVAGAAKSAGAAMQEKALEAQYEVWKKLSTLSQERLLDIFEHDQNPQKRALVVMALAHQGRMNAAEDLIQKIDSIKNNLKRLRAMLAAEDNRFAKEQRDAIDRIFKYDDY